MAEKNLFLLDVENTDKITFPIVLTTGDGFQVPETNKVVHNIGGHC